MQSQKLLGSFGAASAFRRYRYRPCCTYSASGRGSGSADRHGLAWRLWRVAHPAGTELSRAGSQRQIFIGYSDITALHLALLAQTGAPGFAGPMLCSDFGTETPSAMTMNSFWRTMTQPTQTIKAVSAGNPTLKASGMLWGGNLAMIVHLLGTPYFPQVDGGILFIEDVNEHPYRVERMLLQLEHAGVLARQKAVLLGDFSNYRLSDYDNGYNFEQMLAYARQHLSAPLVNGLPFGHIPDRVTLPVGGHADLQADEGGFTLTLSGYPTLPTA